MFLLTVKRKRGVGFCTKQATVVSRYLYPSPGPPGPDLPSSARISQPITRPSARASLALTPGGRHSVPRSPAQPSPHHHRPPYRYLQPKELSHTTTMPGNSLWLIPPPSHPLTATLQHLITNSLPSLFPSPVPNFQPHITITSDIPLSSPAEAQQLLASLALPTSLPVKLKSIEAGFAPHSQGI